MREITEEEIDSGKVKFLTISGLTERKPYLPRPTLSINVIDKDISAARIFYSWDGNHGVVDYFGKILPTRYVKGSRLPYELNRAATSIATNSRRGAGNKIYTGGNFNRLPKKYLSYLQKVEKVDWLPKKCGFGHV